MTLQTTLKKITPASIWNAARETRDTLARLPELPDAYFHPWRRQSLRRLAALRDIHKGQRAFIIGNGPSLKNTDLTKLKDEITFGVNRIYILFPKMGFTTTYFLSINSLVIEQCHDEILALPIPKFLSWRSHRFFDFTQSDKSQISCLPAIRLPVFLYTTYTGPKFARDARGRMWEGATVTYVALQLAFHMGFQQVILIGVDHSFSSKGKPNSMVVSQGDDENHFAVNYFGSGFRWQLPDLETSERAYRMARKAFELAGRQVLDATIGGKLTVFPKIEYPSLF
ncbi:MAG: 6-hydroxymethylpterin diphosphokinase MptE-like protein [Chloroflexota bacterium]